MTTLQLHLYAAFSAKIFLATVINSPSSRLYGRTTPRKEAHTPLASLQEHEVHTQPSEFSRIFEAHHGMIFRTAYRITGNAADAEDVLQTVFLRLLRQPAGAAPIGDGSAKATDTSRQSAKESPRSSGGAPDSVPVLRAWTDSYFRRAAVNASLDIIRQKQTARAVPINEATLQSEPPPAPDSGLKECLRRALRTLTQRAAEIFTLRYFEDLSNQQIASALDISQVLVAVSLHRSRRQLQKEIRTCLGGTL